MKKEKDISILSMQRVVNFGSVLQAYSLKEMIEELAAAPVRFMDIDKSRCLTSRKHISETVDYEAPAAYPPGIVQKAKRKLITMLSAYNKKLIRRFMKEALKLDAQPSAEVPGCVVIGSDEVFNHSNGVCLQLHGDVAHGAKVVSYAASCGNAVAEDILPQDRETVRQAMENFSAISVRDFATEAYVKDICGKSAVHHLDPVLVGSLPMRQPRKVPIRNYMVVYAYGQRIRTEEEIRAIQDFAKAKGLKTVALGGSQFWCDLYIPAAPFRMLDYFAHADYVVTDTFHGTIFSVINQRKFAVIARKTNYAKITGLLEDLGLNDRLVTDMQQLSSVLETEIDYCAVDEILARERSRTRQYLKAQLKE